MQLLSTGQKAILPSGSLKKDEQHSPLPTGHPYSRPPQRSALLYQGNSSSSQNRCHPESDKPMPIVALYLHDMKRPKTAHQPLAGVGYRYKNCSEAY
ncbi:MAG: hypothetical protein ACRAUW_13855 [Aeromonas sp.]|uniref:hypothetical protein n=1 Tax=Aeromonas sp. TaxID=647 RepID=UPI003D6A0097